MFNIGDKVTIKKSTNHIASRFNQDAKDEIVFKIIEECENNGYIIEALTDHHTWWVLEENLLHHTQWVRKKINKENNMEFTKSELDNGMVVELRNGMKFLHMNGQLIGKDIYSNLELYYNDNLLNLSKPKLDIIKVYDVNWGDVHFLEDIFNNLISIWEREEKEYPILTKYQYYSLSKLSIKYDYKWIAKDKNYKGAQFYKHKPQKNVISWWNDSIDRHYHEIFTFPIQLDDFDFVKWEDEEPWSIKELLENCEVEE